LLVASAILLDFGVSGNLVLGQRVIFGLRPELRSRLNGLFIAAFFVGGAIGSALGGWVYVHAGWTGTVWCGFAMPVVALVALLLHREPTNKDGPA